MVGQVVVALGQVEGSGTGQVVVAGLQGDEVHQSMTPQHHHGAWLLG